MLASHELLGFMSPSLALEILNYTYDNDKPIYRAALTAVAEARKLRPIYLERQPRPQRHTAMLTMLTRPGLSVAADSLIRTWLLKKHAALLGTFLDTLKIPHEKGVVEDLPKSVDDEALKAAVNLLIVKFPAQIVAIYLHAFNDMNETHWPNLEALLKDDVRLQIRRDP